MEVKVKSIRYEISSFESEHFSFTYNPQYKRWFLKARITKDMRYFNLAVGFTRQECYDNAITILENLNSFLEVVKNDNSRNEVQDA